MIECTDQNQIESDVNLMDSSRWTSSTAGLATFNQCHGMQGREEKGPECTGTDQKGPAVFPNLDATKQMY